MDILKNIKKEKSLTKVQLSITLILVLVFSVTGATYAYFAVSATNNNTITGDAATVNLTLSVERIFPTASSTNTGVMVPQLSTDSPLSNALKGGCVDDNTNIVCQVYKVNILNDGGTATQVVDGKLLFYGNSAMTQDISTVMPNLRWKLITSANSTTPTSSVLGNYTTITASSDDDATANIFADDVTLAMNDQYDYYIIVWIHETNSDQTVDRGKSFYGKIEFNSSNGTGVTSTFTT